MPLGKEPVFSGTVPALEIHCQCRYLDTHRDKALLLTKRLTCPNTSIRSGDTLEFEYFGKRFALQGWCSTNRLIRRDGLLSRSPAEVKRHEWRGYDLSRPE